MYIKEILSRSHNDYRAIMTCEVCGHEQEDPEGYADANYAEKVIPAMACRKCGVTSKDICLGRATAFRNMP